MIYFKFAGDVESLVKALAAAVYDGEVESVAPFFVPGTCGAPDLWELSKSNNFKLYLKGEGNFLLADRGFCEKRSARWIAVLREFGIEP